MNVKYGNRVDFHAKYKQFKYQTVWLLHFDFGSGKAIFQKHRYLSLDYENIAIFITISRSLFYFARALMMTYANMLSQNRRSIVSLIENQKR
jgi:hypothetical protein